MELTFACNAYDRTSPLQDKTVKPDGLEINYLTVFPGELFRRQARHAEFDIAEFSLSTHALLTSRRDSRMVGIPVFPSRMFRHSYIFVRGERQIQTPQELRGARIGVQEFQQTASVWIRGILQHEYDVAHDGVEWYIGPFEDPGTFEARIPLALPDRVRVREILPGTTLVGMLEAGEIDALIGARWPRAMQERPGSIVRLIEDSQAAELDYFGRTGIYPIMHTVVLRRDLYERSPWIATSLFNAFVKAKAVAKARLAWPGAVHCMLPWLPLHLAQTREAMGDDPFVYGLEQNRRVLETFLQYSAEQGILESEVRADDLFAPETHALIDAIAG